MSLIHQKSNNSLCVIRKTQPIQKSYKINKHFQSKGEEDSKIEKKRCNYTNLEKHF